MTVRYFFGLLISLCAFASCNDIRIKENEEWKKYFDAKGVTGCFEIYDNNKEIVTYYNKDRCAKRFSPGGTFDLFNALVALETDVAPDEQFTLKWEGLQAEEKEAGAGVTLVDAFKTGNTAYFQELARRINKNEMQHFLDTAHYGNMQMGTSLDRYWLDQTLKITADEQVGLMKRLYHAELAGFSERAQRIVRGMMIQEETESIRLYYKMSRSESAGSDLVWLVGFIEHTTELKNPKTKQLQTIPHPYFFALNFTPTDTTGDWQKTGTDLLKELLATKRIYP